MTSTEFEQMTLRRCAVALLLGLSVCNMFNGLARGEVGQNIKAYSGPRTNLTSFSECRFVPATWADGDSFSVRFPDETDQTVRLYGVDCIEWHVTDETDARRLRAQRRYFGIAGEDSNESIKLAKDYGERAYRFVSAQLSKPFTVHTAFADARGDGRHQRVYAFVTTAGGEDLATLLVDQGLARAYGVSRAAPDDTPRDDYRSGLQDAELVAASRQRGIWKHTDWDRLPKERRDERREADLMARSMGRQPTPDQPVDLNGAAMDDLIRIPGIGEVLAHRIVENRPYVAVDDVSRVPGIGPVLLERIRPYVSVTP